MFFPLLHFIALLQFICWCLHGINANNTFGCWFKWQYSILVAFTVPAWSIGIFFDWIMSLIYLFMFGYHIKWAPSSFAHQLELIVIDMYEYRCMHLPSLFESENDVDFYWHFTLEPIDKCGQRPLQEILGWILIDLIVV